MDFVLQNTASFHSPHETFKGRCVNKWLQTSSVFIGLTTIVFFVIITIF